MGQSSKISWTDSSWNPWKGCNKVSKACDGCYMDRAMTRFGVNSKIVVRQEGEFKRPLNEWRTGRKIFVCSNSDFFHQSADEWRNEAWEIIKNTPQHTYLILTKRPERIKDHLPSDWSKELYSHVWMGVTVEHQDTVHRIHILGEIPCEIKWVSFEPLLGEVYLSSRELDIIQWGVIGGMSGYKSGPFKYEKTEKSWFLSLMYQMRSSKIPIFFKQLGSYYHNNEFKVRHWAGEVYCDRFPNRFKVRQYPVYRYGEQQIDYLNIVKDE